MTTSSHCPLEIGEVQTLIFAGGGNRCWWQAGVVSTLLDSGWKLPPALVGTSAGAAMAFALMTSAIKQALDSCRELYRANQLLIHRASLLPLRFDFAHAQIYPDWIESIVTDHSIGLLRDSPSRLRVGISRPASGLGLTGSLAVASIAYILERYSSSRFHPVLPRYLGLRQQLLDVGEFDAVCDLRRLLQASAAAAPFMKAQQVNGQWGFDGGYTDNAPIPEQSREERERTLVLLTRHYPGLPQTFRFRDRVYWQPSRKIPVSTWDCRPHTTVDSAFELGMIDATAGIRSGFAGQRLIG